MYINKNLNYKKSQSFFIEFLKYKLLIYLIKSKYHNHFLILIVIAKNNINY